MDALIEFEGRKVGLGCPVFLIAEAGVNHNGSLDMARKLIFEAKAAGADCVKFQTFKADRVVTSVAPKAAYQNRVTDPAEKQIDMLRKLELDEGVYGDLIAACRSEGIVFTSTPYNEDDIEFLVSLDVPVLKAASIHIAEPKFLQAMAATGKPLLVSTGMATWEEVSLAIRAIRETGNQKFVMLQCTTNYPSAVADAHLNAMTEMARRYDCLVGYSDHTQSRVPCIASVAMGACVIEKHFTLDQSLPGPDHTTSEDPIGFRALVDAVREAELSLGSSEMAPTDAERANMEGMRRSLTAKVAMRKGHVVGDADLICRRPATGLAPKHWEEVVGRIVKRDIAEGEILAWDDFGA